ncbi:MULTISPECIES: hypothetical protein [unclassified Bradyrhizobium]
MVVFMAAAFMEAAFMATAFMAGSEEVVGAAEAGEADMVARSLGD